MDSSSLFNCLPWIYDSVFKKYSLLVAINNKKCIEIDPEDAVAYNNLGMLEEKLGRNTKANTRFEKADEISKNESSPFFGKFNKGMDRTTESYMSFTNIMGRKLKRGVVFILLMTVGSGVVGYFVPGGFIPAEDMGYFYVNLQLPDAAS